MGQPPQGHRSPDSPRLARALALIRARRGPAGPRAYTGPSRACGPGLAGPRCAGPRVFRSAFYRVYVLAFYLASVSGNFFLVFILALQQSFSHIFWRKLTLLDPRVLSGIPFGILSGICVWHVFSHSFWHSIWHNFWQFLLPCYLASLLEFFLAYVATEYCIFSHSLWHAISPRRLWSKDKKEERSGWHRI